MPLSQTVSLRMPTLKDGMSVFRLIQRCPPLDANSSYCNFLQCGHFASTSVAAERDGELVGFISGYLLPDNPDTLFIWQVAVDERARGLGLASQMLQHILSRNDNQDVRYINTTITEDNEPSWGLFKSLAKRMGTKLDFTAWLDKQAHFDGQHDSESLICIGPFNLKQI